MDDPTSLFSIEDDGSLLILTRNITSELDAEQDSDITVTSGSSKNAHGDADATAAPIQVETKESIYEDCQSSQEEALVDYAAKSVDFSTEDVAEDIDVSFLEIQQILAKEQENLSLLIQENEMMRSMVSMARLPKPEVKDAAVNTSNPNISIAESTSEDHEEERFTLENHDKDAESPATTKSCQKLIGKLSNNLRRRRVLARLNRSNNNPFNVQTFIQDYYRSLDSVSRYIIAASILSFFTAFLLLSWYSSQTHSHDMELFKLKEQRMVASQEAFDTLKLQNENFRESIIHQTYEESRECRSVLQSCHSKRDELLTQISKLNDEHGKVQTKLEAKVETQRKAIQVLKEKLHDLQDHNMELRKEVGHTFSSSCAKIILAFLNICMNRSVQVGGATLLTVVVLLSFISTAFSK